jgi:hypothetical protein
MTTEQHKETLANIGTQTVAEGLLQFFEYGHLKPELQNVSRPFGELAQALVQLLPRNPERTVALRKLLESKDCAVRAYLYRDY